MSLNVAVANGILKQLTGQEADACPAYVCRDVCYMGLLTAEPTEADYHELMPTGTVTAPGYERALLGSVTTAADGTRAVDEAARIMSIPTDKITVNERVFYFGENTGTAAWPTVTHFGIFNAPQFDFNGNPIYGSLVLYGALNEPISVPAAYVPLFRAENFEITFTDSIASGAV